MKRFTCVLSVLIIAAVLLAACAPAPATETPVVETTAPEEPAEPAELVLWIMPNGADPQGAIDAELADFMAQNPTITVTTEVVGWGDAYSRIQTAVQGGEGPCVTQLGTTWVPTFGTIGGMVQYTDAQVAALGGEENFVPASWSTAVVEAKWMPSRGSQMSAQLHTVQMSSKQSVQHPKKPSRM